MPLRQKEEAVRRQMKTVGILDDFDVIVCGDMVTKSKPDPDIYLKACELIKVDPKECYAVEDSYNGIRSAHAAGMKSDYDSGSVTANPGNSGIDGTEAGFFACSEGFSGKSERKISGYRKDGIVKW